MEGHAENGNTCPQCGSEEFKLYFLNYKEKMLMCGNTQCDYPFNSDDIKIVETNELGIDSDSDDDVLEEVTTPKIVLDAYSTLRETPTLKDSNKKQNTKDLVDLKEFLQSNKSELPSKRKKKEDILEKKLCQTNELFNQLYEKNEPNVSITNSKWIKNLLNMQTTTKTKLLTNEEVCFLGISSPNEIVVKPKLNINYDQNGELKNVKDISDDDNLQNNCLT